MTLNQIFRTFYLHRRFLKWLLLSLVVLLLAAVGFYLLTNQVGTNNNSLNTSPSPSPSQTPTSTPSTSPPLTLSPSPSHSISPSSSPALSPTPSTSPFVLPEYNAGALMALLVCFAAFATFKIRRQNLNYKN